MVNYMQSTSDISLFSSLYAGNTHKQTNTNKQQQHSYTYVVSQILDQLKYTDRGFNNKKKKLNRQQVHSSLFIHHHR